jgi:curli biogenesis system outer membrane secretion channel CsgG
MKKLLKATKPLVFASLLFVSSACTHETSRTMQPSEINAAPSYSSYQGARVPLAVGEFANRSGFRQGVFFDTEQKLDHQAKQILVTHLSQSQRFQVYDRMNIANMNQEQQFLGKKGAAIQGSRYLLTGAVTEFGRREIGNESLGGLIHKSKSQQLHAKVQISVVDSNTSAIIGSYQGEGEFALGTKRVLGFGSRAGYDATLADKVLNLAIMEAVKDLIADVDQGRIR